MQRPIDRRKGGEEDPPKGRETARATPAGKDRTTGRNDRPMGTLTMDRTMGGSAGQGQGKLSKARQCLGAKALATKSAR